MMGTGFGVDLSKRRVAFDSAAGSLGTGESCLRLTRRRTGESLLKARRAV